MGLQDRDYMHERDRRRSPFTPPPPRQTPAWAMFLCFALAGWGLFKGYQGWLAGQASPGVPAAVQQQAGPDMRPPPVAPDAPAAAPRQLVRCSAGERTLYTEAPCPAGTVASRTLEDPVYEDPVYPGPSTPAPQGHTTLYHCKAYDGGTFWASRHCNQQRALVDRMVQVPAALPFHQQVEMAERHRRDAGSVAQGATPAVGSASAAGGRARPAFECQQLNEHIAQIDSLARQALPAWRQDQLRAERKAARDRQFALRC